MDDAGPAVRVRPAAPGAKVTRLELFFDLVFVFAFIHLNTLTVDQLDSSSLTAITFLLAALWLVWSRFAVLGNNLRADQGVMPIVGFVIMTAIFISVTILPDTSAEDSPPPPPDRVPLSVPGEFVFPACFCLIWVLEILALRYAARGYPRLRQIWLRSAPALALSTVLLVLGAIAPPRFEGNAQVTVFVGLWVAAIAVAYLAVLRPSALTIVSAGHWAERHAQIILIALGETVISIGIGADLTAGTPLTLHLIGAVVLGIALICALWWTYFDARSIAAEQVLHRTQGIARIRLARDAYTLLHFPMVLGIILLSLGVKQVLTHISGVASGEQTEVLDPAHLHVLYGGVLIYLVALLAFQARTIRTVRPVSVVPVLLLGALLPVAEHLPPLAALAALSLVTVTATAVENRHTRGERQQLREARLAEQQALESEETDWRRRHL
ncbi:MULTISPECIES: low temperature requirement protein A [unclassified Solwaraspora]|uniref:low temperature requirement protein A n=1 Tax=unclassified Solwaraspora TaxID=2627926 RepID=UPI00259B2E6D|nr:low temperature requirement protein A [Solwaraspora sp. WMMA2056]WJK41386.1 low temperature requirement protein A [Solwaraspora sp. WMMA2056]